MNEPMALGTRSIPVKRRPLAGLLTLAVEEANGHPLQFGQLVDRLGPAGFGPLLAILGIIALSPIGAIPLVPSTIAVTILLVAGQLLIGQDRPWLPRRLREMTVPDHKLRRVRVAGRKYFGWVDRLLRPRLGWATGKVAHWLAALACVVLAITMVPLEAVPFAVALPGTTILVFGLALTARDGLLMIGAFTLTITEILLATNWLNGLF